MIDFEKLSLQQLEVLREQWYVKATENGIVKAIIEVFLMFGENLTTDYNHKTSVKFEVGEFKMLGCVHNTYDDPALLKPKHLVKLQAFYQGRLIFDVNQKIFVPKQEWVDIIKEYSLKVDKIVSPIKEEKDKVRKGYLLEILGQNNS